jgi:hypothetical protein
MLASTPAGAGSSCGPSRTLRGAAITPLPLFLRQPFALGIAVEGRQRQTAVSRQTRSAQPVSVVSLGLSSMTRAPRFLASCGKLADGYAAPEHPATSIRSQFCACPMATPK